jgi:hypothetical protein
MEVDPRRSARKRTPTPFVQAGLALLVAGTLVAFSFLAFRTGFADEPRPTIAVAEPERSDGRPVLLPSPGRVARDDGEPTQGHEGALVATTAVTDETDERVLGTRIGGVDDSRGTGNDTRGDLDDDAHKRTGSAVPDDDEGWKNSHKPAIEKHGKSHTKAKKGPRALGHHKHKEHKKGRGHSKHHH